MIALDVLSIAAKARKIVVVRIVAVDRGNAFSQFSVKQSSSQTAEEAVGRRIGRVCLLSGRSYSDFSAGVRDNYRI